MYVLVVVAVVGVSHFVMSVSRLSSNAVLNRLKDAIKSNDVDMQQYILCCFTHLSMSDR